MTDVIAIWGAVTGTLGVGIATRREVLAQRKRLHVEHGSFLVTSREEPRQLERAWVSIRLTNTGGRPLAVEHIGIEWAERVAGYTQLVMRRGEVALDQPIVIEPDGPSRRVTTPLGPLLRLGLDPRQDPTWAIAFTTGEVEWVGTVHPLVTNMPQSLTEEAANAGFARLREEAEDPPDIEGTGLYGLRYEDPMLPEE
jgi:hypothetical protein